MKHRLIRSVGVDAETAAGELMRIHDRHGALTPSIVVSEASDPAAVLHPCFDWNDESAAEKYRLQQARNLIRAVHVVSDEGDDLGCIFVNVSSAEHADAGYRTVAQVVNEPDALASAMAALMAKLVAAQRAVEDLQRAAIGEKAKSIGVAGRHLGRAVSAMARAQSSQHG